MTRRAQKVLAGDIRSAARLMRDIDDPIPRAIDDLKALYPHTGKGYIIGITGKPVSRPRPESRRGRGRSDLAVLRRRHSRRSHSHAASRPR